MVNDFLTRLANLPGPYTPFTESPFDVYRPDYTPAEVDQKAVVFLRDLLFGDCLSNEDMQARAFLLTKVVSSTELIDYITKYDTRVTYSTSSFPVSPDSALSVGLEVADLESVPESVLSPVLSTDELLIQFNLGTYFDRLAAIVVGLVEYEKSHKTN